MNTSIIKIKFIDNTELVVSDVDDFGYNSDTGVYYVRRFGYRIFFNPKQVKYIGREFDINNEPRKWI